MYFQGGQLNEVDFMAEERWLRCCNGNNGRLGLDWKLLGRIQCCYREGGLWCRLCRWRFWWGSPARLWLRPLSAHTSTANKASSRRSSCQVLLIAVSKLAERKCGALGICHQICDNSQDVKRFNQLESFDEASVLWSESGCNIQFKLNGSILGAKQKSYSKLRSRSHQELSTATHPAQWNERHINVKQVSFNPLMMLMEQAWLCGKPHLGLSTRATDNAKYLKSPPPELLMRNKCRDMCALAYNPTSLTLIHHSHDNFHIFLVDLPVVCATTSRKRISSLKMLDYVYSKCKAVQPFHIGAYWFWSRFNFRSNGKLIGLLRWDQNRCTAPRTDVRRGQFHVSKREGMSLCTWDSTFLSPKQRLR